MSDGVAAFKEWLVAEYRPDGSWENIQVLEGSDAPEPGLCVRLDVGKKSYYEVRVPESLSQVQVGFGTESRVINEAIEEMILDNGGDLDDLLGDELCDLGDEPRPMEHFFERPVFRYAVRMPLQSPPGAQRCALRPERETRAQSLPHPLPELRGRGISVARPGTPAGRFALDLVSGRPARAFSCASAVPEPW